MESAASLSTDWAIASFAFATFLSLLAIAVRNHKGFRILCGVIATISLLASVYAVPIGPLATWAMAPKLELLASVGVLVAILAFRPVRRFVTDGDLTLRDAAFQLGKEMRAYLDTVDGTMPRDQQFDKLVLDTLQRFYPRLNLKAIKDRVIVALGKPKVKSEFEPLPMDKASIMKIIETLNARRIKCHGIFRYERR